MRRKSDVIDSLRAATRAAHQRLESELDVIRKLSALPDRRCLIKRYYEMHAGAEALLAPWLAGIHGLDYHDRKRTGHLLDDLRCLGVSDACVTPAAPPIEIFSRAEALGFLYVLEGSTLGGRVILRELVAQNIGTTGLSFLDPHGASTGVLWRGFLDVLEREVTCASACDDAVAGAVKGFNFAQGCLCKTPIEA